MEKCSIWRNKQSLQLWNLRMVNEDGTLNLRLFNRENDINWTRCGLYPGLCGVSHMRVDLIPSKNWSQNIQRSGTWRKFRLLNNFKIRICQNILTFKNLKDPQTEIPKKKSTLLIRGRSISFLSGDYISYCKFIALFSITKTYLM
jgi:hypothetical protein